jgi:hypothetical protein
MQGMSEDEKTAEQRRRLGLGGLDPRKAVDPATMERLIRAQEYARAQAAAATTVVLGTVVTLISSAFGFVAALAWNDAIRDGVNKVFGWLGIKAGTLTLEIVRALLFTVIAIVAIVVLQRIAGRWAKRAAINAAAGDASY